jgi:hypothetical protein
LQFLLVEPNLPAGTIVDAARPGTMGNAYPVTLSEDSVGRVE